MKKILIVDDEKDIRFILEEILTENNYSVVSVGTIKEAEEFIRKPFMDEAVELRRFDDLAKILNKKTPDVEHFRPYLEEARQSFLAKQA